MATFVRRMRYWREQGWLAGDLLVRLVGRSVPRDDSRALTRAFAAIAIATILSCAIFVVWPTTIPRPPVRSAAFDALWLFDVPANCFPSLHVALASIAACFWPRRRWIAVIWAVAIALSTLTTKQHYAVDVAGGVVVAGVAIAAARFWIAPDKPDLQ